MMRSFLLLRRMQAAMGKGYKVSMSVEHALPNPLFGIEVSRGGIRLLRTFTEDMVKNGSSLSSRMEADIIKKAKEALVK